MTFSPAGFLRTPEQGLARLHWHEGAWAVDGQALDLAQLRPLRGLDIDWPTAEGVPDNGRPSGGAHDVARSGPEDAHGAGRSGAEGAHDAEWPGVEDALGGLARLAAAGVPLTASSAPAWVPVDLAALLTDRSWLEHPADDSVRCLADLRREEHSVRLRRVAAQPVATAKVSVVMATKRPGFVGGALAQMARQRGVEVEVILGLHGVAYDEVRQAAEACPLPLRWIEAGAETPFGEVLNQAAALAERRLPGQVGRRRLVRPRPPGRPDHGGRSLGCRHGGRLGGVLLSGAAAYHDQAHDVRVRGGLYRARSGPITSREARSWCPWRNFSDIGGFPGLPRAVDARFLKAAHEAGARIYRTHGLGYMLRRGLSDQHTWQLPLAHFLKVAANQWYGFRPSLLMEPDLLTESAWSRPCWRPHESTRQRLPASSTRPSGSPRRCASA